MGKFLILAIILAFIAGAYMIIDDDGDSDYTLLDHPENIVPGLTVEIKESYGGYGSYHDVYTVTEVKEDYITYTKDSRTNVYTTGIEEYFANDFEPNAKYTCFDYTSSTLPEAVTVEKEGNFYKLNGYVHDRGTGLDLKVVYEDLVIEYDGKNVLFVDGAFDYARESDDDSAYNWEEAHVVTMADTITGICERIDKETFTCDTDAFYDVLFIEWNPDYYKGCEIVESQGRYGGVDVDIYTINGPTEKVEYEDFKVIVYDDYFIKVMGYLKFGVLTELVPMNYNVNINVVPIPEPVTGLKLLDSADNIVPGMTIETDWLTGDNEATYHETTVVNSVVDGEVEYTNEVKTEYVEVGARTYDLIDFEPNGFYINFDYTSGTIPEGVNVYKVDDTYTLDGKFTVTIEEFNVTTAFKDLAIIYDGKEVKAVDGTVDIDAVPVKLGSTDRYVESATLEMVGDFLSGYGDSFSRYTATVDQDKFYETVIEAYDPVFYKGCVIKESKTIYEGVEVNVYDIEGDVDFYSFKDFEVFEYNGFEILNQGLVATEIHPDFTKFEFTVNVYIADLA